MRKTEVLKKIRKAAQAAGLDFEVWERTNHTGIRVGNKKTTIGRHNEVTNLAAQSLYKQLEEELGKDWWR